jgi:ribosomal protein L13
MEGNNDDFTDFTRKPTDISKIKVNTDLPPSERKKEFMKEVEVHGASHPHLLQKTTFKSICFEMW